MYAKIFQQIYSSSIAADYLQRLVFMDMLVLADQNGVVDMTHDGIARFTNVPLEIVTGAIAQLESPDAKSRNKEAAGARLVRLDEHRDWGWMIVNYQRYREIASEEQRRETTRERVAKFRAKNKCNASVTSGNVRNGKQREKQKDKQKKKEDFPLPVSLAGEAMEQAWREFQRHRIERKKKMTALSAEKIIAQMTEWGITRSIAAINHSILNGWQGLFEPKENILPAGIVRGARPPRIEPSQIEHVSGRVAL